MDLRKTPVRHDGRVIIHFDYDCFYASVFEARDPALRTLPFAVQQKQIIVTCNYEARRRGLHKLQLIREARRVCPDVIIKLGEDLTQFRDASKELYNFIKSFSWNGKVERLGFDEVWMDVTDIVSYNVEILNKSDLAHSFFHLSRDDPTSGFEYDASSFAGFTYPEDIISSSSSPSDTGDLVLRLCLGSHLSLYLRHQLEQQKGYTSTVGIATSKLLSKLVGSLHKPKGQTTIVPPFSTSDGNGSNVQNFLDDFEIGKIPGVGFKLAPKLRAFIKGRPADFDTGLVYGVTKEPVNVSVFRNHPEINPVMLEKLLAGPGSPRGIGAKVWALLHGVDDSEVTQARSVPHQISMEDSYIRLDTFPEVVKELTSLATSVLNRMRTDLLATNDDFFPDQDGSDETLPAPLADFSDPTSGLTHRWLAHPRTIRLSTRPRQPLQPDGTRVRSFKRISHSCPLPSFVFDLYDRHADQGTNTRSEAASHPISIDRIVHKLVHEVLIPMFRHLHPEKAGWNLSLVNIAVTNMAETGGDSKTAKGRDIGDMFRKQEDVLKHFKVIDAEPAAQLASPRVLLPAEDSIPEAIAPDGQVQNGSSTNANFDTPHSMTFKPVKQGAETPHNGLGDEPFETMEDCWESDSSSGSSASVTHIDRDDDGARLENTEGEQTLCEGAQLHCRICGLRLPAFAVVAHERFHVSQRGASKADYVDHTLSDVVRS